MPKPGPVPHYEVQPDPNFMGRFRVVNTAVNPPKVHSHAVSKAIAVKQWRLLEALKHDPKWTPTPGVKSNLKHVPGPGKYPGTGYSQRG